MIHVELTNEKISLDKLMENAAEPFHGAQIIFSGRVRNHNQGKKVMGVSYDAYQPLAKTALEEIATEAKAKWGDDLSITVAHRFGRLGIGEVSVVILVSSRHRDESYKASRYVIEQLKVRAAIWKQEHYEDGDSEWLQGHALCGHYHAADDAADDAMKDSSEDANHGHHHVDHHAHPEHQI